MNAARKPQLLFSKAFHVYGMGVMDDYRSKESSYQDVTAVKRCRECVIVSSCDVTCTMFPVRTDFGARNVS